jgi:hypothetical protein
MIQRSALSLEFVRANISATEAGDAVTPTGDPISFAFVPIGTKPTTLTTFTAGNWETDDSDATHPVYYARILVGPGGTLTLAVGEYDYYVKVSDNPEIPVLWVDAIKIV